VYRYTTVGYPLPGYVNPGGLAFSPDDAMISNLYSAEGTLSRKLYAFDVHTGQQR
jgi:sugar lactone lactonase YvrE